MTYEPQPGTIPYKAVAWLRAQDGVSPGRWYSTPELCERIDTEVECFSAYMRPAREHGLVHTEKRTATGKLLWWRIGDGTPQFDKPPHLAEFDARLDGSRQGKRTQDEPQKETPLDLSGVHGEVFPGVAADAPLPVHGFRAIEWEGYLLATGMEIRDGVAIFTPEHVAQLKRHTDWWPA
jgi:hypothetical protein